MTDNLIERLRDQHRPVCCDSSPATLHADALLAEAADRIEHLEAEIERRGNWQTEAIAVLDGWHRVAEMVPHKPAHLGRSQSDVVAERITELEAELSAMRNRGGHVARFGCPNCAGAELPAPVMCCVRCGNRYYTDTEANE